MKIVSKNFVNNGKIPTKFTCDSENDAPELTWSEFPKETKSFVLTFNDPDSPSGNFIHWLVINIPADVNGVQEGSLNVNGGEGITNDFGQIEYGGPCPAVGEHHYIFTVYALKVPIITEIDKNNLLEKIKPYILDKAQIIGLYKRG